MARPFDTGDDKVFTDESDQSSPSIGMRVRPICLQIYCFCIIYAFKSCIVLCIVASGSTPGDLTAASDDDRLNNSGRIRRPNGQRNAHEHHRLLDEDEADEPQPPDYGAVPQHDEQQEVQEGCRALIKRCLRE